jgi:hypothetical protein
MIKSSIGSASQLTADSQEQETTADLKNSSHQTTDIEEEFYSLCSKLQHPIIFTQKFKFEISPKHPLRFWQALAFLLKSKDTTHVAIASFIDKQGKNQLYIATQDELSLDQKKEMCDIINMFLELQPKHMIRNELVIRHNSYINSQFDEITSNQRKVFAQKYESELSNNVKELARKSFKCGELSLEDIKHLLDLIAENIALLRSIQDSRDDNIPKEITRTVYRLLKIYKLQEDINIVWNTIKKRQQDPYFQTLNRSFQFISFGSQPELAILKFAKNQCTSKTLYIGMSKLNCH